MTQEEADEIVQRYMDRVLPELSVKSVDVFCDRPDQPYSAEDAFMTLVRTGSVWFKVASGESLDILGP